MVPDDIKKEVRAVLLSKIGGIKIDDFEKDYKKLLLHKLDYRKFGFSSLVEFLAAIPDVVRLEFVDKEKQYRLFGLTDPANTYTPLAAKKAEFKPKVNQMSGRSKTLDDGIMSSMHPRVAQYNSMMVPNLKGHYSVCFTTRDGMTREEIVAKFSVTGEIKEVNQSARYTFVRYGTKEEVVNTLIKLGDTYNLKVPEDRGVRQQTPKANNKDKPKKDKQKQQPSKSKQGDGWTKPELFVGNVPLDPKDGELLKVFKDFEIENYRFTTRGGKRFGFLLLTSVEECQRAIEKLDRTKVQGRSLIIRLAGDKLAPETSKNPGTNKKEDLEDSFSEEEEDDCNSSLDTSLQKSPVEKGKTRSPKQNDRLSSPVTSVASSDIGDETAVSTPKRSPGTKTLPQTSPLMKTVEMSQVNSPTQLPYTGVPGRGESINVKFQNSPGSPMARGTSPEVEAFIQRRGRGSPKTVVPEIQERSFVAQPFTGFVAGNQVLDNRVNPAPVQYPAPAVYVQRSPLVAAPSMIGMRGYPAGYGQAPHRFHHPHTGRGHHFTPMQRAPTRSMASFGDGNNNFHKSAGQIPPTDSGCVDLYVANFPPRTHTSELWRLFQSCNPVSVIVKNNGEKVLNITFAFIKVKSADDAERAILELDGTNMRGYRLSVRYSYTGDTVEGMATKNKEKMEKIMVSISNTSQGGDTKRTVTIKATPADSGPVASKEKMQSGFLQDLVVSNLLEERLAEGPQIGGLRSPISIRSTSPTQESGPQTVKPVAFKPIVPSPDAELDLTDVKVAVNAVSGATGDAGISPIESGAFQQPSVTLSDRFRKQAEQANEESNIPDCMKLVVMGSMLDHCCPGNALLGSSDLEDKVAIAVTCVVNETYFWAQIVNADEQNQLEAVSDAINNKTTHSTLPTDQRKCVTQFYGEYFRAWVREEENDGKVKVFYIDWGNEEVKDRSELFSVPDSLFTLWPLAVPFRLAETCTKNMRDHEMSKVFVKINRRDVPPTEQHIIEVSAVSTEE